MWIFDEVSVVFVFVDFVEWYVVLYDFVFGVVVVGDDVECYVWIGWFCVVVEFDVVEFGLVDYMFLFGDWEGFLWGYIVYIFLYVYIIWVGEILIFVIDCGGFDGDWVIWVFGVIDKV